MTIDPITMVVVDILGKYAVDKGVTLLKEAGQATAHAAAQLFDRVMARLKADPADARNAERFEQNPEGYQVPVADAITEKMKTDLDFATQLKVLLEDYQHAISAVGVPSINVGSVDSGAVAMQGGVAAGKGGAAVAGNVQGGIKISNRQNPQSLGEDEP